jgi:hypothetical protein
LGARPAFVLLLRDYVQEALLVLLDVYGYTYDVPSIFIHLIPPGET